MLNCISCKFKRNVPGGNFVQCTRNGVKLSEVSEHGKRNGWFYFPFCFEPIWASGCNGFVDKTFDIETASKKDIIAMYILENSTLETKEGQILRRDIDFFETLKQDIDYSQKDLKNEDLFPQLREFILYCWGEKS